MLVHGWWWASISVSTWMTGSSSQLRSQNWSQNRNSFFWDTSSTWFPSKSLQLWIDIKKSSTDLLIPAKPFKEDMLICGRSLSGSLRRQRKWFLWDGCTTAKPNIGISMFFQQLVDISFHYGGGRFPMVEIGKHCSQGSPSYPDKPDTQLFTDASNIGWGAHWNALTVSGVWTTTEKTLHTNVLDLEAIHWAMLHWLRKLMGLTVMVASENSTIVSYINKHGWTRSIQLNKVNTAVQTDQEATPHVSGQLIVLRARHIPGRLNILADILWHPSQMSGTEWSLHPSVFRALIREWRIPLLDLFATK